MDRIPFERACLERIIVLTLVENFGFFDNV